MLFRSQAHQHVEVGARQGAVDDRFPGPVGAHAFGVWHVPGHAPGHVAFVGEDVVLGGDCLFAGSVGRTDLPLCDPRAFAASLARLMTLGDAMRVLPGHGPATSIGRERVANPFLNGQARVPGA